MGFAAPKKGEAMSRTSLLFVLAFCTVLVAGRQARAENDQTAVIGFGFGIHTFSQTDDFRRGQSPFILELDIAGMGQLYAEWYLLEEIGLGVRLMSLGVTEEVIGFGGTGGTKELSVRNVLGTVTWVPVGATGYTRLGLIAGAGVSDYEATNTFPGQEFSGSTSGLAALLGIYVDWGGKDFGARFGANVLSTQLDKLDGAEVDASGTAFYFDLRWAFE
jgi:hypothetical protein